MFERLISIFIILFLVGCSSNLQNDKLSPGTPVVSQEQAKHLAMKSYGLKEITSIELRTLTKKEMERLTNEQKRFTPVYYAISGEMNGHKVVIFVSSNNIDHHFEIESSEN